MLNERLVNIETNLLIYVFVMDGSTITANIGIRTVSDMLLLFLFQPNRSIRQLQLAVSLKTSFPLGLTSCRLYFYSVFAGPYVSSAAFLRVAFYASTYSCGKRLLLSSFPSVCPSWTDIGEMLYKGPF